MTSTTLKSIELNLELGVEFEETTADGRQVNVVNVVDVDNVAKLLSRPLTLSAHKNELFKFNQSYGLVKRKSFKGNTTLVSPMINLNNNRSNNDFNPPNTSVSIKIDN